MKHALGSLTFDNIKNNKYPINNNLAKSETLRFYGQTV